MSTLAQGAKGISSRNRSKKPVPDLNVVPSENRDQVGTSAQDATNQVQVGQQVPSVAPTIDVEALDDDVVESSPTAFAEARNNARRTRSRTVFDVESGCLLFPLIILLFCCFSITLDTS
ncbi:unnamed protein product [Linum tenue]|nr:unnamed protein product [Linum tenue]